MTQVDQRVEDMVLKGIRILERLARINPHSIDGHEDKTGCELGINRRYR